MSHTAKRSIASNLLKGLGASALWQVGYVAGQLVPAAMGLPIPPAPEGINPVTIMLLSIPAGMILTITLGQLFQRLRQPFFQRVLTIFAFNYLIYGLLQVMEQLIFTGGMSLGFGLVSNLLPAATLALAVGALWRPSETDNSAFRALLLYLSERRPGDWLWRLAVAWLIYLPIYYVVGRIISPIVAPYYSTANLGMGLVMPELSTIIDTQLIRGAIFLVAVAPIIVLWQGTQAELWRWLGLAIVVQLVALPMIMAYWLPVSLRVPHGIELIIDSFAQAYIYVQLLFLPVAQCRSSCE